MPGCFKGFFCNILSRSISFFGSFGFFQRRIVQLSYWHDPVNENDYKDYNLFLSDLNQEKVCTLKRN